MMERRVIEDLGIEFHGLSHEDLDQEFFTDTFTGIDPNNVLFFLGAQLIGAYIALCVNNFMNVNNIMEMNPKNYPEIWDLLDKIQKWDRVTDANSLGAGAYAMFYYTLADKYFLFGFLRFFIDSPSNGYLEGISLFKTILFITSLTTIYLFEFSNQIILVSRSIFSEINTGDDIFIF